MPQQKQNKKISRSHMIFSIPISLLAILAAYTFYPMKKLPPGTVIDRLVVYKSKHKMEAYSGNTLLKTYTVALGKDPNGHKQYEGDGRTPEGSYTINARNPSSGYHKNLGVSYPNAVDIAFAKNLGKPPGGDIKIHGLRNGRSYISRLHRFKDWTAGCIAVTNDEVDELYACVKQDAVIEIKP